MTDLLSELQQAKREGNRIHCENCDSSGFVGDNTTGECAPCPYCHGKGWIWQKAKD